MSAQYHHAHGNPEVWTTFPETTCEQHKLAITFDKIVLRLRPEPTDGGVFLVVEQKGLCPGPPDDRHTVSIERMRLLVTLGHP